MKVLQVIASIDPKMGGPTRSCKGLCRALAKTGTDVTLLVLHGRHAFEDSCGVKVLYADDTPLSAAPSSLRGYDVVHLHGLWDLGLHRVAKACRKADVRYVFSPRGMLDPWALSVKKWKKRLGMLLYQRADLRHAFMLHATAEMEARHIHDLGFRMPVVVAANGVDIPAALPDVPARDSGRPRTALFLSRLHPGKGLLTLAEAWARVRPAGWTMRVVGPDDYGHKAEVLAKLDALAIPHCDLPSRAHPTSLVPSQPPASCRWEFVDMVDDQAKWLEYASADLLVHPSVSENFGITIAEGLYAGLPVIATQGTPWESIEANCCGKWIDIGVEPLADALQSLVAMSDAERCEMGRRGHQLVERDYVWASVITPLVHAYGQALNPCEHAPCYSCRNYGDTCRIK